MKKDMRLGQSLDSKASGVDVPEEDKRWPYEDRIENE
jgi:hypothetical protein